MREIKFRVWVKSWKWIDFPTSISIDDSGHIEGVRGYGGDYPYTDIELMQFTGLHDKNGREIYKDDIVRVAGVTDPGMKWVVTWSNASWELHHVLGGNYMNPMRLGTMSVPIEVVGNIWENPKLLEASK